jgi:hypothetical protein
MMKGGAHCKKMALACIVDEATDAVICETLGCKIENVADELNCSSTTMKCFDGSTKVVHKGIKTCYRMRVELLGGGGDDMTRVVGRQTRLFDETCCRSQTAQIADKEKAHFVEEMNEADGERG